MSTLTHEPFVHHMNAMREHYKSGASQAYALPLKMLHPVDLGEMALAAFAVTGDDSAASAEYKIILGNAETTLTSAFAGIQSSAADAVKAFEQSSDINTLLGQLNAQKGVAQTTVSAAIDQIYDPLIDFGNKHPHTQSEILSSTNQIGGFISSLLDDMHKFFEKLAHDIVTWSQKVVTVSIWASIGHWFTKAARSIGNFFTKLGADIVHAFDAIAKAAEAAWDGLKDLVEKAIMEGVKAILEPLAKDVIKDLPLSQIAAGWTAVQDSHADHIATIKASVMDKQTTPEARKSMVAISQAMAPHLNDSGLEAMAATQNNPTFLSTGIEFQATAAAGIGAEGAIGMLSGLAKYEVVGYGSIGATIGAEAGAEVDVALVLNRTAPNDSGGGYVGILLSLEIEAGSTIQVQFSFPELEFTGVSIGLGAGEEVAVGIAGGYTWIF